MPGSSTTSDAPRRRREWPRGWRVWLKILHRVSVEIGRDHLSLVAAGVAFFTFLSIFPALAALAAIYGLVFEPGHVTQQMEQLVGVLPDYTIAILEQQFTRLSVAAPTSLSWSAVVAVLAAIWSANKGSNGLIEATNLAYDRHETRGFVQLHVLGLALTVGAILMLAIVIALVAGVPLVIGYTGIDGHARLIAILRWPLLTAIVLSSLGVLYVIAPDRPYRDARWITPGSVVATALLLVASGLFSTYVSSFGSYDETYGSIGAVAVFLLWLYLASFVVLVGAEINAEVERELGFRAPTSDEASTNESSSRRPAVWRRREQAP